MKKLSLIILLTLLFSFLFTNDVCAYDDEYEMGYGLKLSYVSADQTWNYYTGSTLNTKPITTFEIGIFSEWEYTKYFSVVYGVHFIQKGMSFEVAKFDDAYNIIGYNDYVNIANYLSLPILFKLRYKMKLLTPYFIIGPRIDFFVSEKSEAGNIFEDFALQTVGLDFGLGCDFNAFEWGRIFIELRMSRDLQEAYETIHVKVWNETLQITLGINFGDILEL